MRITKKEDLDKVVEIIYTHALRSSFDKAIICTLSGDLGVGKTTLVQMLAKKLGITETVQSPTFVVRKRYTTKNHNIRQLIHIDAYRLESAEEVRRIGFFEDMCAPHTLVCIEWPEQMYGTIPHTAIAVYCRHVDKEEREVSIVTDTD